MSSVAVIDIGSNSIKVLVAERAPGSAVQARFSRTLDARISAGISHAAPRLSEAGMQRGVDAVRQLVDAAAPYAPDQTLLVATSAVRDAENGRVFTERVRQNVGYSVRLLSGEEEATFIGRGLLCDPALPAADDFYVFDLGGGSLECLAFRRQAVVQAVSFPLGCVRLTERFVAHPDEPLAPAAAAAVRELVRHTLTPPAFDWVLPPGALAIATGGTVTTARAIWAARAGRALDATSAEVPVAALRALASELGSRGLADRQSVAGLPPARADVFPVALHTLVAVAERGAIEQFHHSLYNLRFGIAADALGVG